MKIVINACYGGFSISKEAAEYMAARGHEGATAEIAYCEREGRWFGYGYTEGHDGYERHDPLLVEAVEALGEKANGFVARLKVVEIPDGVEYKIEEYDGNEHVAEVHRTWH